MCAGVTAARLPPRPPAVGPRRPAPAAAATPTRPRFGSPSGPRPRATDTSSPQCGRADARNGGGKARTPLAPTLSDAERREVDARILGRVDDAAQPARDELRDRADVVDGQERLLLDHLR